MIKNQTFQVIAEPLCHGQSKYINIPKKKCILEKGKFYIFDITVNEVHL